MISCSSSLASSAPATSRNVTLTWFSLRIRALLLPNLSAADPPDCIWRRKKSQMRRRKRAGIHQEKKMLNHGVWLGRERICAFGFFSRISSGSLASSAGR